jgi:hypothetical protein
MRVMGGDVNPHTAATRHSIDGKGHPDVDKGTYLLSSENVGS